MKKILSTFLAIVMAMTMLVGCKKEEEDSTSNKEREKKGETEVIDPELCDEEGRLKLLIGLPGGDGVTAMQVIENFKNNNADKYNITLDEGAWSDFTKKVKLQIVAKNDVTPVFFSDSAQIFSFGAQGAAHDLTAMVESLDASKYNAALYALEDDITDPEATHIWGVPHAVNSIAMIYNKDIFDKYNVPYPTEDWTFDDMIEIAGKLTKDTNGDGQTDIWGLDYYYNITQGWLPFLHAYGASPYRNNFRDANLDSPEVKKAYEKYYEAVGKGYVIPDADRQASGGATGAFGDGMVAMSLVQYASIPALNRNYPDLNYDAIAMPYGDSGKRGFVYVSNSWMIYSGAHDAVKAAAEDFLKYYLSEEAQMINAKECPSGFPIMKSALEVAGKDKNPVSTDAFFKYLDTDGTSLLENPCSSAAVSIMNGLTGAVKSGENIDENLAEAQEKLQNELDYYYDNLGE